VLQIENDFLAKGKHLMIIITAEHVHLDLTKILLLL